MSKVGLIILAGGKGTRLRPVTFVFSKALVPFAGVRFLTYQRSLFEEIPDEDVYISVSFRAEKEFSEFLRKHGLNYKLVCETEPLGTGGGIKLAMKEAMKVANYTGFFVTNGDIFVSEPIPLKKMMGEQPCILAVKVKDRSRYGTLTVEEGWVRGFVEKDGVHSPGTVNGGIYYLPSDPGFPEREKFSIERDFFQGHSSLRCVTYGEEWSDVGTVDSYIRYSHRLVSTTISAMKKEGFSLKNSCATLSAEIYLSQTENSIIRASGIFSSRVRWSFVHESHLQESCVENSVLINSTVVKGKVRNSLLINSTVENTELSDEVLNSLEILNGEVRTKWNTKTRA